MAQVSDRCPRQPFSRAVLGYHRLSAPQARLDFAQNQGVIYSHDGKGKGQRAPEIRVLLPADGRSEDNTGSWGWSFSLLTPLGRFCRAGLRKVDSRDPKHLTLP